jgi:hypothetical protein
VIGRAASNIAILAVRQAGILPADNRCGLEASLDGTGKMPVLQHFAPFALVFEHDFAQQTNGWHAVVEQLVVEFLQ